MRSRTKRGTATGSPGGELAKVLRSPHHIRIIRLLRHRGSLGFTEIQEALSLNPAQVDRSLMTLTAGLWVVPRTERSSAGPIRVRYRLGERGKALAQALDAFRAKLAAQQGALGEATVREAEELFA